MKYTCFAVYNLVMGVSILIICISCEVADPFSSNPRRRAISKMSRMEPLVSTCQMVNKENKTNRSQVKSWTVYKAFTFDGQDQSK